MKRSISQAKRDTPWSKLVCTRWPTSEPASAPKYVFAPVAAITAVALPLTTFEPMKHRLRASSAVFASASAPANFSTGIDSPVSADWLTNKSFALSRRRSAGTMSPADR